MPKVSVLLSVHNGERHLHEAVSSVLGQSFKDLELLIVDDASTDSSPEILRSLHDARVGILRNEARLGLTRSLNRALEVAQGELIARLDADDFCGPERIARQVEFLDQHPDIGVLGCDTLLLHPGGRRELQRFPSHGIQCRWHLLFGSPVAHSAAMFRSGLVRQAGGYDETVEFAQDYDLWSRLASRTDFANLPVCLVTRRVEQSGSVTVKSLYQQVESAEGISARNLARLFDRWPGATRNRWKPDSFRRVRRVLIGREPLDDGPSPHDQTALLEDIYRAFMAVNRPSGEESAALKRWLSRQLVSVASSRAGEHRRLAMALTWFAIKLSPSCVLSMKIGKLAARLTGGRKLDHWVYRLTGGTRGRHLDTGTEFKSGGA